MSQRGVIYRMAVNHVPNLGPDEEPYMLHFFVGGLDHAYVEMKLFVAPNQRDKPYVELEIPLPKNVKPGEPFLNDDAAIIGIQYVSAKSEDDEHIHKLGVNEAGTVCFPLKLFDGIENRVQATQTIRSYNAIAANSSYDGDKGKITLILDKPQYPGNKSPFLPPNEFTLDHTKTFDSQLIVSAIESSFDFPKRVNARFSSLEGLPGLPPYQFHQWFIPGQMLAAKRNVQPMDETWWKNLITLGLQRAHPDMTPDVAKMHVTSVASDRDKMAVLVNAFVIPCNYWRYYPDQTQKKDGEFVQIESFGLTTRSKLAIVGNKMYSPLQDCEDDEEDIQKLAREFQDESVHLFKDPFLRDLQKVSQKYVFLQALCGVNGQQVSDGKSATKDPYANMGGHEVGVMMPKSTFVKLVGKINTNRPLFKGWCEEYDPDAPFDENDKPMMCEGTGTVEPMGGGYRVESMAAFRYIAGGESMNTFNHMKFIEPQNTKEINPFYRAFVSFVVPELYDQGFSNVSFTAMTIDKNGKPQRNFTYNDLMNPHDKIGLHTDVGQSFEQAKLSKHIASFYPSVVGYNTPCPVEKCPIRSKLMKRAQSLTDTMKTQNRIADPKAKILIADFYPTYYQMTKERIANLCDIIKKKSQIIDVEVSEEAISTALGGYRIAFHVQVSQQNTSLISRARLTN